MKLYNEKTAEIKHGAIRQMFYKAQMYDNVISMGMGEPDMTTPEAVCAAAKESFDLGLTHYTPNAGMLSTRRAIAERTHLKPLNYDPEREIIITNGGMGALSMLMAVILNPGDEVLVQDPQWLNYVSQIRFYDGVPVRVPTRAEDRFEMRSEVVEQLITPKTRALMINTPNNPTGYVTRPEALEKLAALACKHDLLVISDEVYHTLVYDGADSRSIASFPGMKERTIICNSFSKSYAMTGWRVGYAAAPEAIVTRMSACQEILNSCVNASAQYAAAFALEHGELSEQLREVFASRRRLMLDGLHGISGMEFEDPDGAFYIFPSIKHFGMDDVAFCNRLLEEEQLVCIPGSAFGACGEGHIRIAYTASEAKLSEGLKRLSRFCRKLV